MFRYSQETVVDTLVFFSHGNRRSYQSDVSQRTLLRLVSPWTSNLMLARGLYSWIINKNAFGGPTQGPFGVGPKMKWYIYCLVDVLLAYFVTTRLWFMMHSVILNLQLQQPHSSNHLSRLDYSYSQGILLYLIFSFSNHILQIIFPG